MLKLEFDCYHEVRSDLFVIGSPLMGLLQVYFVFLVKLAVTECIMRQLRSLSADRQARSDCSYF